MVHASTINPSYPNSRHFFRLGNGFRELFHFAVAGEDEDSGGDFRIPQKNHDIFICWHNINGFANRAAMNGPGCRCQIQFLR